MAIKYDNCKNCHSLCIHAGKDREFVCINGVSCKITTECTDEVIDSIRDYMVQELLGGFDCRKAVSCEYEWTFKDGSVVELRIAIKQPAE